MVLTCSDVPTILLPEVRQLIDRECYVELLSPMNRRGLILDWMRRFQSATATGERFKNLTWSIELDENSVDDDPDHIVNLMTIASQGTTPCEIYKFLRRINDACSRPREDGSTDYNEDLINKLLFSTELGKSIVPYNPETENSAINKFLGIDYASAATKTVTGKARLDPLDQKIVPPKPPKEEGDNIIEDDDADTKRKVKKIKHAEGEGAKTDGGETRDMHTVLTEQAAARQKVLRGAAKRDAEKKKRIRNGGHGADVE